MMFKLILKGDSAAKSNYKELKAEQTCLSKSRIARRGA
ncbi:hypothetical protein SYNTR_0258 [Candidatus Syntrophocurvum alkaliphilum]|uniref:Uncharacterized protein n=1 Tax=Candidatus Syntrophocurvum alkaliphilum TaxID=2293317 RepID=A0A6I6DEA6_9FIRM|nr:hypothetical protein SYNTR_0258 [Candidatus Syntrophocurvum alkaliphilum]